MLHTNQYVVLYNWQNFLIGLPSFVAIFTGRCSWVTSWVKLSRRPPPDSTCVFLREPSEGSEHTLFIDRMFSVYTMNQFQLSSTVLLYPSALPTWQAPSSARCTVECHQPWWRWFIYWWSSSPLDYRWKRSNSKATNCITQQYHLSMPSTILWTRFIERNKRQTHVEKE